MDYLTIINILDSYKCGKSIDDLSNEYMIPVEGIKRVIEFNRKLKLYDLWYNKMITKYKDAMNDC